MSLTPCRWFRLTGDSEVIHGGTHLSGPTPASQFFVAGTTRDNASGSIVIRAGRRPRSSPSAST